MKKHFFKLNAFFLISLLVISSINAQENINIEENFNTTESFQQPFKLDILTDSLIGGIGGTLTATAAIFDKAVPIKENNYNFDNFPIAPENVNSFDRHFIRPYSKTLDYVGDGVLALTLATPALMLTNSNTDWITVATMYTETILLANGIKEWGKLLITRPRPYMYFENYPKEEVKKGDWHNSMPSGHTTMAFAGAAFTSAVFNEYFPDSPWRHVVTAASFGIATSVGIIRMCSGNHFATDVITGAAIGTLCGFIVPFFHSQTFNNLINKNKNVNVAASPLGFNVAVRF